MNYPGTRYIRHRRPSRLRPILTRVLRFSHIPMLIGALVLAIASPASGQSKQAPLSATTAVSVSQLPSLIEQARRWWVAPVAGAGCSSPYGWRRFYDSRLGRWREGMHYGRDLTRYYKAPVKAVANGTVIWAGWRGGYGYAVELRHGKGQVTSLYGHLTSIAVHKGQWVRMGNLIGRMGATGDADGVHTHFEIRVNGVTTNPDVFMRRKAVRLCG